jgi:hypothetical protein
MGKPVVTRKGSESDPSEENITPLPPLPKDDDFADDAILDEEK